MSVTLIADASYAAPGVAGWAAWAKTQGQPSWTWHGKLLAKWVDQPAVAELAALAMGLERVAETWPGLPVLAQSDCYRALVLMRSMLGCQDNPHPSGIAVLAGVGATEPNRAEVRLLQGLIRLQTAGLVVSVRHVKGHVRAAAYPGGGRGQPAGRHRVNSLCDRLAKREMREIRDGLSRAVAP